MGNPVTMESVVCLHEEDYGVLWKHTDWRTGAAHVRRSRRLSVSFFATIGNYDYGCVIFSLNTVALTLYLWKRLCVSQVLCVLVSGNVYDSTLSLFLTLRKQDASIQFEVKLTGIVSTGYHIPGTACPYGQQLSTTGLYAPIHQHFFTVRLHMAVDGHRNRVVEVKQPIFATAYT
jgi:primary-amine oxidase